MSEHVRTVLVFLVAAWPAWGQDSPVLHARLAAQHRAQLQPSLAKQALYISFYDVKDADLGWTTKLTWFWMNNLNRTEAVSIPREVRGGNGRLFLAFCDDFGWTTDGLQRAIARAPHFRDIGGSGYIVKWDWLIHESADTRFSEAYYDLLYGRERVHKKNFPATSQEFDEAWGADVIMKLMKEKKLQVDKGSVVRGQDEGVSQVANSNRIIWWLPLLQGDYWRTFDVKEPTGKRNYAETLIFDFESDAGEFIARLPNGGQAYLLADGAGKRIEQTDRIITHVDVWNGAKCLQCHTRGIIEPENLVSTMAKAGIVRKNILPDGTPDFERERRIKSFFLSGGEKTKTAEAQARYLAFCQETGWDKAEDAATALTLFLTEYDKPMTLAKSALELGVPEEEVKAAALRSTKAQARKLAAGLTVPKRNWTGETFQELQRQLIVK